MHSRNGASSKEYLCTASFLLYEICVDFMNGEICGACCRDLFLIYFRCITLQTDMTSSGSKGSKSIRRLMDRLILQSIAHMNACTHTLGFRVIILTACHSIDTMTLTDESWKNVGNFMLIIFTTRQQSCGKVKYSRMCVCMSVRGPPRDHYQ